MKGVLSRIVKGIGFVLTLFFSSGLEPWALRLDKRTDHVDRDDVDFLLDMAQFYAESQDPIQDL